MILLTGGTGLLGKQIAEDLSVQNRRFIFTSRKPVHSDNCIIGDLKCADTWRALEKISFNKVIHLAANVPEAVEGSQTSLLCDDNKIIDESLLNFIKSQNLPCIYASSISVGNCNSVKQENTKKYITAKLQGEKQFLSSGATVVRLPALVGDRIHPQSIINRFINSAIEFNKIEIWGSGSREQNFLHVKDASRALIEAGDKRINEVISIANEHPISMYSLAKIICDEIENCEIVFTGIADPNEEQRGYVDTTVAKQLLNWEASCDIKETIKIIVRKRVENRA